MTTPKAIDVLYTNWRGERSIRKIRPVAHSLHFGNNEWHRDEQWLFDAFDLEKGAMRTFALKDCVFHEPTINNEMLMADATARHG